MDKIKLKCGLKEMNFTDDANKGECVKSNQKIEKRLRRRNSLKEFSAVAHFTRNWEKGKSGEWRLLFCKSDFKEVIVVVGQFYVIIMKC